jgi:hypothetical protein
MQYPAQLGFRTRSTQCTACGTQIRHVGCTHGLINYKDTKPLVSSPPPLPWVNKYVVYTYTVCGVIGGEEASDRNTPAAKSLYKPICKITTFGSLIFLQMYCSAPVNPQRKKNQQINRIVCPQSDSFFENNFLCTRFSA